MTTPGVKRVRSFIAITVPSAVIQVLDDAVKSLDSYIGESVRWVRTEGIHLTLKFMGDIEAGMVDRVLEAMPAVASQFSPFELAITGLGVFPNPRRPRVLWSGVHGEMETLAALQLAIDDALGELGLRKEQRAFSPHLTLGRVRRDVADGQLRSITLGLFRVTPVTSRSRPQAVPHRLFVTPRRPALFRPDAPASFMRLPIGNNPRCRRSERRRLLSWGIGQKKAVSFQDRGFQQSASETALRGIWPRFPWASRRR